MSDVRLAQDRVVPFASGNLLLLVVKAGRAASSSLTPTDQSLGPVVGTVETEAEKFAEARAQPTSNPEMTEHALARSQSTHHPSHLVDVAGDSDCQRPE